VKSRVKSRVRIVSLIGASPSITALDIAHELGLSLKGVEKALAALKAAGHIRRVGPDKGGHWEVTGGKG